MENTQGLGVVSRRGDHYDVRFERHYGRPVETVWSALTEPERLKDWMGVAYVEPFVGGRFDLIQDSAAPMTGRVRVWEPPEVLEFSWSNDDAPDSVIRYELTPAAGGTRLVFRQTGIQLARSALMLPGWHWLFDRLGNVLDGTTLAHPSWRDMQKVYVETLKLEGVLLHVPPKAAAQG
ncbi:MAG: SRPBCC family protein [Devosia sp.]|nr:SRPBCC family protein [Devosia sp.]